MCGAISRGMTLILPGLALFLVLSSLLQSKILPPVQTEAAQELLTFCTSMFASVDGTASCNHTAVYNHALVSAFSILDICAGIVLSIVLVPCKLGVAVWKGETCQPHALR